MPKFCAKCKRKYWNGMEGYNPITPRERSMRMRLYKFGGRLNIALGRGTQYCPNELCKKFLSLNPRPTLEELHDALYPLGWNPYKHHDMVPDDNPKRPQKQGMINLKRDESRWIKDPKTGDRKWNHDPDFVSDCEKLLIDENEKRKQFMKKVIKSRGENVPKEKAEEKLAEEERKRQETVSQLLREYKKIAQKKIK